MNQKNSLGLNKCFKDLENPIDLFKDWYELAKKSEPNDPNALALGTADEKGVPTVRMVLLKDFGDNGFVFFTNMNSVKSTAIKKNPKAAMCFHWKSLLRQIRINGTVTKIKDEEADKYYLSRSYGSKVGAWVSNQSSILDSRKTLSDALDNFKEKFPEDNKLNRPSYWSGWRLIPNEIEFWLDGQNRIHERLKYLKRNRSWKKVLLYP